MYYSMNTTCTSESQLVWITTNTDVNNEPSLEEVCKFKETSELDWYF